MASLSLKNVTKKYPNGFVAVKDFNLEIADKEFIIFVGPSGCGKSTTLRMIAGLEDITSGELYIDGKLMNDVEPKDRDIAMVFQNYALYPHMTVYDNMAFGLKLRKMPKDEIDRLVQEAAKILDLSHLLDRKPKALSGGQRQALTLLMSTIVTPKLLLLDEHTAALDPKTAASVMDITERIVKENHITTLMITHNMKQALEYGNKTIILNEGKIVKVLEGEERKNTTVDDLLNMYDFV